MSEWVSECEYVGVGGCYVWVYKCKEMHEISVLVNFEQHTIVCTSKLAVGFKLDVIRYDGASDNIK